MERTFLSVVVVLTWIAVATCWVPCDSPIRRIPTLSRFFKHCKTEREECVYGDWTDVKAVDINTAPVAVPFDVCKSELALRGERWKVAAKRGADCEDRREKGYLCLSTCSYAEWTALAPNIHAPAVRVPSFQCESERALPAERQQRARGGYECNGRTCEECRDRTEERYICEPTIAERLILQFELGRTGQNHREDGLESPNDILDYFYYKNKFQNRQLNDNPLLLPFEKYCSPTQICWKHNKVKPDRQTLIKDLPIEPQVEFVRSTIGESQPLPMDPLPFDLFKYGGLYQRQTNARCHPDDTRYVLFLLDTSESVAHDEFKKVTSTLGNLVHYFCRRTKISAVSFSDKHYLEFCFDCFGNDCTGRDRARDAMADIKCRGGLRFTGEATQCVCDSMFTSDCGFPELSTEGSTCLDVIYVTDGKSNGRSDVCKRVECLYDLEERGVSLNVFAFGIDGYDIDELRCITRDESVNYINNKIFEIDSFDRFEAVIDSIDQVFEQFVDVGSGRDMKEKYFYGESGSGKEPGSGMESGSGLDLGSGSGFELGSSSGLGSGIESGSGLYYFPGDILTSDCLAIGASDGSYDDCF